MAPGAHQRGEQLGAIRALFGLARRFARRRARRLSPHSESGQVAVEAAFILPMMLFLILGIIQLTMMQQARLMLEYAAFNAARTGVVWSGDKRRMTNAALISLLPTFSSTDTVFGTREPFGERRAGLLQTWLTMKVITELTGAADAAIGGAERLLSQIPGLNLGNFFPDVAFIEIDILHPFQEDIRNNDEADFDRINTDAERKLNRLTLGLRYLYPMRIPFANWIIHETYLAGIAGMKLTGPMLHAAKTEGGSEGRARSRQVHREAQRAYRGSGLDVAVNFVTANQLQREVGLISMMAQRAQIYLIPLRTTYSMHMHSNLFKDNLDNQPRPLFENPFR